MKTARELTVRGIMSHIVYADVSKSEFGVEIWRIFVEKRADLFVLERFWEFWRSLELIFTHFWWVLELKHKKNPAWNFPKSDLDTSAYTLLLELNKSRFDSSKWFQVIRKPEVRGASGRKNSFVFPEMRCHLWKNTNLGIFERKVILFFWFRFHCISREILEVPLQKKHKIRNILRKS